MKEKKSRGLGIWSKKEKNFMLMILSESHKEWKNVRMRMITFKEKRCFRWQQWGILGNERKFDPVDERR